MYKEVLAEFLQQIDKNNYKEAEKFFEENKEILETSFIHLEIQTRNVANIPIIHADTSFYINCQKTTTLHIAVFHEADAIVTLLLKYGVNVNELSVYKNTVISAAEVACMVGSAKILKILLDNGADISGQIGTNCLYSSMLNNEITEILCKNSADVNGQCDFKSNNRRDYLINNAISRNRSSFIKIILAYGADVKLIKNCYLFAGCLITRRLNKQKITNYELFNLLQVLNLDINSTIITNELIGVRHLIQGELKDAKDIWIKTLELKKNIIVQCDFPITHSLYDVQKTANEISDFTIVDACIYAMVIHNKYIDTVEFGTFQMVHKSIINTAFNMSNNTILNIDMWLYETYIDSKYERNAVKDESINIRNLRNNVLIVFITSLEFKKDNINYDIIKRWVSISLDILKTKITQCNKDLLSCKEKHYTINNNNILTVIALISFIHTFSNENIQDEIKQLISLESENQCCTLINAVVIYELMLKFILVINRLDHLVPVGHLVKLFIFYGININAVDCEKNTIIHRVVDNINTLYFIDAEHLNKMIKYGEEYIELFKNYGVNLETKNISNVTGKIKLMRIKSHKHSGI